LIFYKIKQLNFKFREEYLETFLILAAFFFLLFHLSNILVYEEALLRWKLILIAHSYLYLINYFFLLNIQKSN